MRHHRLLFGKHGLDGGQQVGFSVQLDFKFQIDFGGLGKNGVRLTFA